MPEFPATRAGTISKALVRAGCLPLQAGETQHPSGPAVLLLYELVLESLASSYPWHHFRTTAKLQRQTSAPELGWKYAFSLPANRTGLPFAYFDRPECRTPFHGYELRDGMVLADVDTLYARYPKMVEPGAWPGYFIDLYTLNLAAEYALAVREDERLRAILLRECFGPPEMHGQGGRFAYAASADSQRAPAEQAGNGHDPLAGAYRSGG